MSVVPLRETDAALPRGWRHFLQGSGILGTEVFWAFLTTYPQDVPLILHVLIYKMWSMWFFLRHTYLPVSSITAVLFSMFSLLFFYQLQGLESKFLVRKHKVRWGEVRYEIWWGVQPLRKHLKITSAGKSYTGPSSIGPLESNRILCLSVGPLLCAETASELWALFSFLKQSSFQRGSTWGCCGLLPSLTATPIVQQMALSRRHKPDSLLKAPRNSEMPVFLPKIRAKPKQKCLAPFCLVLVYSLLPNQ